MQKHLGLSRACFRGQMYMLGYLLFFFAHAGEPSPLEQTRNLASSLIHEEGLNRDLERAAIQGMLNYMDSRLGFGQSTVMNTAQKDEYLREQQGFRNGYGLRVQVLDRRGFFVEHVFKDGPAYKAGIRYGDIIVQIGSRDLTGLDSFQMIEVLNQPFQETNHFEILRKGQQQSFDIAKDSYRLKSVLKHNRVI